MFDGLYSLISNGNLYSEGEEWFELLWCVLDPGQLPQVFRKLPDYVVAVFKATLPSPSTPGVIELDQYGMSENQPPQQAPPVALLYVKSQYISF